MSRTDLDPTTLAASLRRTAGDGSVEWVTEPMQTRVLLDMADMLDENAKLRELVRSVLVLRHDSVFKWLDAATAEVCGTSFTAQARELGVEVDG